MQNCNCDEPPNKRYFTSTGLYTGSAGVAYALLRVVKSNLFPDKKHEFLKAANMYLEAALDGDNMRYFVIEV